MALSGQLLIAMPGMDDPRFAQSVIYLCAHTEDGAMGLVLNRPIARPSFGEILEQLQIDPSEPAREIPLCAGGPVEHGRGFVLHSADWQSEETLEIDETHSMTASLDILRAVATGEGPQRCVLALGYAGWDAGQLDGEIQNNIWLTAPSDDEILFDSDFATKWRRALGRLGIDPGALSGQAGRA